MKIYINTNKDASENVKKELHFNGNGFYDLRIFYLISEM